MPLDGNYGVFCTIALQFATSLERFAGKRCTSLGKVALPLRLQGFSSVVQMFCHYCILPSSRTYDVAHVVDGFYKRSIYSIYALHWHLTAASALVGGELGIVGLLLSS